jgi:hypothetical protein
VTSGVAWSDLYFEAVLKGFQAQHNSLEESWYLSIAAEIKWRSMFCFLSSASSSFVLPLPSSPGKQMEADQIAATVIGAALAGIRLPNAA